MLSRPLRSFAIAITLLSAAACSSSYSSSPASPSTSTAAPTTPSSTSTGPSVTAGIPGGASALSSTAFGTNPLTIAVGTTVAWTNNDSIAHTSTADASQWNSGTINPGQTFRFTFTSAGRYTYHCTIHPNMVGTVTVQ
jgi:plastocyanin